MGDILMHTAKRDGKITVGNPRQKAARTIVLLDPTLAQCLNQQHLGQTFEDRLAPRGIRFTLLGNPVRDSANSLCSCVEATNMDRRQQQIEQQRGAGPLLTDNLPSLRFT